MCISVAGCRYCAAGMSTRSWVMRYIISSLASVLLCCKVSNHLAGTVCGLVVAYDKSCCFALDSFELLNVAGSVGVPDGSCILNHRSDERSLP